MRNESDGTRTLLNAHNLGNMTPKWNERPRTKRLGMAPQMPHERTYALFLEYGRSVRGRKKIAPADDMDVALSSVNDQV